MSDYIKLVKLSVGSQNVSDLVAWQKNPMAYEDAQLFWIKI